MAEPAQHRAEHPRQLRLVVHDQASSSDRRARWGRVLTRWGGQLLPAVRAREAQRERRAAPGLGRDRDVTAVRLDDAKDRREAEASATLTLGGKERLEDPRPH